MFRQANSTESLSSDAAECDTIRRDLLVQAGYQPESEPYVFYNDALAGCANS